VGVPSDRMPYVWYADRASLNLLGSSAEKVLLVGGYAGYANFGDILQLKGALAWHRAYGHDVPVVVLAASAIPDEGFAGRVRRWFGVGGVLFYSRARLEPSPPGLEEIPPPLPHVRYLHVYGGGFLNRYWGRGVISLIEGLIGAFRVRHYVLSGQQIGEEMQRVLAEHLRRCPPNLVGARDEASFRLLEACGVPFAFSFDDALEPLDRLARTREDRSEDDAALLLHVNLTYYAWDGDPRSGLRELAAVLEVLRDHLRRADAARGRPVVLLHAYEDRRPFGCRGSLSVVREMEEAFPFAEYRVVNLARLALELDREDSPPHRMIPRAMLAVVGSYHCALLCGLLGVPCYLLAHNAYYRQKRLGLALGETSLEEFLKRPRPLDLRGHRERRSAWLEKLDAAYNSEGRLAPERLEPRPETEAPVRPWRPKEDLEQLRADVESLRRDRERSEALDRRLAAKTAQLRAIKRSPLYRTARRLRLLPD